MADSNLHGLNLRGGASVTVLFDERKAKLKLPHYLRVKCIYCPGAASNRGLCSHDLKWIGLVRERDRVQQNILCIEECDEIINEVEFAQVRGFHTPRI